MKINSTCEKPVCSGEGSGASIQRTISTTGGGKFPILAVDDHPVSRLLLEKVLRKAGHEVFFAVNGREAFELFQRQFFPIVVSDWLMPEMDGLELCRAIRSMACPGYVFIILLTCKNSKADIVAGLEAGADDYLSKPFNPGELRARINTGIRILDLERSLREANEQIRKFSITDPLTGCFNRGYLDQTLSREIRRSFRYGRPLSVVLCDIDHFKRVNDTYGHPAGDRVLKEFASCIASSVRKNVDWLARYGGEEFVLVLPETGLDGARSVAERLRRKISSHSIRIENREIRVTSSFGISSIDLKAADEGNLALFMIEKADRMLYRAKQSGRNRVES